MKTDGEFALSLRLARKYFPQVLIKYPDEMLDVLLRSERYQRCHSVKRTMTFPLSGWTLILRGKNLVKIVLRRMCIIAVFISRLAKLYSFYKFSTLLILPYLSVQKNRKSLFRVENRALKFQYFDINYFQHT